uniref:NADH dehydrogenase subunit 3 n=1 Tax=Pyura mirabilis TaxID=111863 RepID=UPI002551EA6F|nr:NADH dehydrogenase subunit 3 [Pyura mirabilis]UPP55924.1 NADH dehydrogenase subunit 3 [Pyura mirabilis]
MLLGFSFIFLLMFSGYLNFFFLFSFLITFLLFYLGGKEVVGDTTLVDLGEVQGYECGFESFLDLSKGFSVQFFVVGLSFMLFDLEICLFLPSVMGGVGSIIFKNVGVIFLLLVLMIFVYEVLSGVLFW